MTQPKKWTYLKMQLLAESVEAAMKANGHVCFNDIALKVGRSNKSCKQKAYCLGLLFQTKQTQVSENAPRPKRDMVNLPYHANGRRVNYL